MMIDIDHFKSINDTYGHAAGDAALTQIAHIIAEQLRGGDIFARFGGEEYYVFLPRQDKEDVLSIVDRIRQSVAAIDFREWGMEVPLTVGLLQQKNR